MPRAYSVYAFRGALALVGNLGAGWSPAEREVVARHVAWLGLILPATVRRAVAAGSWEAKTKAADWVFKPAPGQALLRWWRSQDPLPATAMNERLEEHLERLAIATQHYAYEKRFTRVNDRGEVLHPVWPAFAHDNTRLA